MSLVDKKFRRRYECKAEDPKLGKALKRLNCFTGHLTASSSLDEQVAKTLSADFHKKSVAERQ